MALAPTLKIPIQMRMMALGAAGKLQTGVLFNAISGRVIIDHAGGFPLFLQPVPIAKIIMSGSTEYRAELEFPISQHQVDAVEKARASADVSLTLQLKVEYSVLCQSSNEAEVGVYPQRAILDTGVTEVFLNIKVPQSIWTKDVLTQLGFGKIILFEIPAVPISALASLGEAFEATKRAHALFGSGEYDLAVGLCRTAVQPLRNHLKKIKAAVGDDTAADWAEKIGDATFDWLNIVVGKTHGMGSAAVHEGSPGRFGRLDAQMILTLTVSLLAYVARLEQAGRS